jgi:hypothetical protein
MYYAPKAELEAKGKCFVEPWIAMATTNKKDLDAGLYSNCPYSIQRRLTCLTVKAKKEFQRIEDGIPCGIDSAKVRKHYTDYEGNYVPPMFDDIWTVTVERAVKPQRLETVASYAPIEWNGKVMVDVSMSEVIQWAIEDFDNHRKNQEALLEGMRERANTMRVCGVGGCKHLHGNCPYHRADQDLPALENQFGRETVSAFWRLWYRPNMIRKSVDKVYDKLDSEVAYYLYNRGMDFIDNWDWIKCVPAPMLDHERAPGVIRWLYQDRLKADYEKETKRALWTLLLMTIAFYFIFPLPFFGFSVACLGLEFLFRQRNLVESVERNLFVELKDRNMEIAPMLRRYRDKYAKVICVTSIGIAAIYGLARAYRAYRSESRQGSLEPQTMEEVRQRDAEVNVWTEVEKRPLPMTRESKLGCIEHLENSVQNALVYGTIHLNDGNAMVNGLMLTSNVMLVPDHYFEEFGDTLECTFRKKYPNKSGGKFTARLSVSASSLIPGTDLRVCYVPNGGSYKDILKWFPTGNMPQVPFRMYWRAKDGELKIAKGVTDPGVVTTTKSFPGGMYRNLTIDTFNGLCGAVLLSETKGVCILGVHLGGTAGTPRGCYGSVTQQQLLDAISELRDCEGVILSGSAGVFKSEVFGVQLVRDTPLHKKSALNYIPQDSQIEYYGSCPGRAIMQSAVKVTPISQHIMDVCGVPNIYRGPKMNPDWYGWQTCLAI